MARRMSAGQKMAYAAMFILFFTLWWKLCMLPFRGVRGFKKFLAGLGAVLMAPGALLAGFLLLIEKMGAGHDDGMWMMASLSLYAGAIPYGLALLWEIAGYMVKPFRTAEFYPKVCAWIGTLVAASGTVLAGWVHLLEKMVCRHDEVLWVWAQFLLIFGASVYGPALLMRIVEWVKDWKAGRSKIADKESDEELDEEADEDIGALDNDTAKIPEVPVVLASSVTRELPQRPGFELAVVNHLLYPDWAVLPACAKEITFSNRGGSVLCLNPVHPWANEEKITDDIAEMTGTRRDRSALGSSVFIGRVTAAAEAHVEELREYFAQLHAELVLVKSARFQGLDADQRQLLQKEGFAFIQWAGWRRRGKFRCGFCLHEWTVAGEAPVDCPACHLDEWQSGMVLRCSLCQHEWNFSEAGAKECPLCGTMHAALEAS